MVQYFQDTLETHIHSCFSWKRVRRKSNSKPWILDARRARMKRRKAVFWIEGRSELWKKLDIGIKKTIKFKKKQYEEKMTTKLEQTGRSNQWYSIYRFLSSDEMPKRWEITELRPDQKPRDLADDLALHFSKITNASKSLSDSDIPSSNNGSGMIPQLQEDFVEKLLVGYKKCSSRVEGDIPKDLVNPNAKKLAEALTLIYNKCMLWKAWPSKWKIETVVPSHITWKHG